MLLEGVFKTLAFGRENQGGHLRFQIIIKLLTNFIVVGGLISCMDQYDPSKHLKRYEDEATLAHTPIQSLNEDGTIPAKPVAAEAMAAGDLGEQKFAQFCVSCHGTDGTAQTPAGKAMNPRPRNFTDKTWQDQVDDAHIVKVIKEGGGSVGLSPLMAPWGAVLGDEAIPLVVKKIRSFRKD